MSLILPAIGRYGDSTDFAGEIKPNQNQSKTEMEGGIHADTPLALV